MSLIEYQFDRKIDKVKQAIERVRLAALLPEPLYVCYSGGKDSRVLRRIMEMSGVKYELHYNHTSVDIPEIVQEIKKDKDIIVDKPRYSDGRQKTMWNLIAYRKIPLTHLIRYCCSELKEVGGMGRICVTGVRKAESAARKQSHGEVTLFSVKSKRIADDYGA